MFRPPAVVNYNSHGSIHGHTQAERRPSSHQALVAHGRQQQLGQLISIMCFLLHCTPRCRNYRCPNTRRSTTTTERERVDDEGKTFAIITPLRPFPSLSLANCLYLVSLRLSH